MRTSQAFHVLLIVVNIFSISGNSQLDEFIKSVKDAHLELDHDIYRRKRDVSIEDLLARFEFTDDDAEVNDSDLESGDAWYQSFRTMECQHGGCQKRPLRWKTKKSQPEEYYEYYEDTGDSPKSLDLKDQWEDTQNDLSHEANYKLSKVEQDAVEQSLPNTAWPIRHPSKRNVDPMEEVKLKTSLRMLENGGGASLPSSVLDENRQKISVNDILGDSKHDDSPDPWKETYEVMESRKLLSIDDSDEGQSLSHALDMEQFDNIKQKTHLDRELKGLSFDNTEAENEHHDNKKSTIMTLSDELMNSAAFLKLQSFLKGKAGKTNKNETDSTTTTSRPKATVPLNLVNKDRDVNINLHMSVNATVLEDGKLPEQFHRNNTITFKPPMTKAKKPKKDRDRRMVAFPITTSNSRRRANEDISKSVIEATEDFPLDEIITGKLTSQLVNTIFALVRSSPNLKVLWPGLKRNKIASAKQVQNFYAIRTHENESEMHRTELMLRQAMETINAIIEQQVRSRSCVPLRADLKAFYNLILSTKADNDRLQDRKKRQTEAEESAPPMTDLQIRKKSRIVKKLLKDYEELPQEDQDQVVSIKESLLFAAEELRELEQAAKRRKRQIIENHLLGNSTSSSLSRDLEQQLTPEYMKLAKTAEMLLHNSLKDSDLPVNFNYI